MKELQFNIATFNVRGLTAELKKKLLAEDLQRYNVDAMCIQETKIREDTDIEVDKSRLICFKADCRHYGNGFLINSKWKGNIHRVWKETDRIAVIQFKTENGKILTIINAYGPTQKLADEKPETRDTFYRDLTLVYKKVEPQSTIVLIAGDLNSKVGKRQEPDIRSDGFIEVGDACLGRFSRNVRNENGSALVEFCETNGLFIANSAFKHPARHQTTWVSTRATQDGGVIRIFNQIDYIICKQRDKHIFQDARSYAGTKVSSDHKLVLGKTKIEWQHIRRNKPQEQTPKINVHKLSRDKETKEKYNRNLTEALNRERDDRNTSPQETWNKIQSIIQKAGMESAGQVEKTTHRNRTPDEEIKALCNKQKELRLKIHNTTDEEKRRQLKTERNRIQHQISERALKLRNLELDQQVEEIQKNADDATLMYRAVKTMNRKKFENPKVQDEDGKLAATPNEILDITTKFFKSKFRDEQTDDIEPFEGPPRRLEKELTPEEIKNSLKMLNNNRAAGGDEIVGELLKYGAEVLSPEVADLFNKTFETHE